MFRKILIANRGEVVERVARTASRLGIEPVVVYSTADKDADYVHQYESVCIGPAASSKSYLNADAILQAGRQAKCAAIHPGWGFLSENSEFAARCKSLGLKFIGPNPGVMDLMSRKTPAKKRMAELGVPGVPGENKSLSGEADALAEAAALGYPVMLKAESGGGGRGMRICRNDEELKAAVKDAAREAKAAFADSSLYMEKYVENGRHIEIQVMVDQYGQAVTFGERECSVQRKHQKLIEESPSPALTAAQRKSIEAKVTEACAQLGYEGAGTVEMLRAQSGELYFIEMNTRLQVEHPVTEMITGVDLVEQQLRVACGEKIAPTLGATRQGHAIECRINAEDADQDFKPQPGTIETLKVPSGVGIRVDTYVREGFAIPPFYDSLIAKLIVHAETRELAINKMLTALDQFEITGVKTTIDFHKRVLNSEEFRSGNYDTGLVNKLTSAN